MNNSLVLISTIIGCTMVGCSGTNPPYCQVVNTGSNVYVHSFGDSITVGAGADNFCLGYDAQMVGSLGFNSDNRAVSGSMLVTAQYTAMLDMLKSPFNAVILDSGTNRIQTTDINTVLPGFNDISNYGTDLNHLNAFTQELTDALEHIASLDRATYVGTPLRASVEMQARAIPLHTDQAVALYTAAVQTAVAQVASIGLPVYLVDTGTVYDPETMSTHNYHPNNYGHQILANEFLGVINGH